MVNKEKDKARNYHYWHSYLEAGQIAVVERNMKTKNRIAVYAGTFDPVTLGHMWMIEAGSRLFDKLVVAVGSNPDKKCHLSLKDRIIMLNESIAGYENVTVDKYSNEFLIRYAESIGAKFVLRGIRNTTDYEYEKSLNYVNRQLNYKIVTVFLLPPREMVEISSSVVRGLIGPVGWEEVVGKYVPACVLERLIAGNRPQVIKVQGMRRADKNLHMLPFHGDN